MYSNLGAGAHGHIGLVLTDAQSALIPTTQFFYPDHTGPLVIPDVTSTHMNSNMSITHTEAVRIFVK